MSSPTLSTLDRIQLEIKESIQREKELKNIYSHGKPDTNSQQENLPKQLKEPPVTEVCNGHTSPTNKNSKNESKTLPVTTAPSKPTMNGFRRFTQNASAKGMMHKFLKSRGKLTKSSINTNPTQSNWISDAAFKPAKMTVEKGSKPLRNGFVPAEEKMKRELQEFHQREMELREERKKSQPNLMAALQLEEENEFENMGMSPWNSGLKPAKSMANLYSNSDEGFEDNSSSTGGSLKPARSLAELCDLSDEEGGLPGKYILFIFISIVRDGAFGFLGTHSLIMQFENMQFKNRPSSQSSRGSSYSREF